MPAPRTACVIPACNEELTIAAVVTDCRGRGWTVYVVDDGSTDATGRAAREAGALVVRLEPNQGKGRSLAAGAARAAADGFAAAVFLDADGQHDPADLPRFLEAAASGAGVVVGCRSFDASMPLVRRLTNRFQTWLLSRIAGQPLGDTQCGFRLVRLDLWPRIAPRAARFAAESEMLVKAARAGARIALLPIQTRYVPGRRSRIRPVLDTARFFAAVLRLLVSA